MIVLVCGSRSLWGNHLVAGRLYAELDMLNFQFEITELIHGDCPDSPDMWGKMWAENKGIPYEPFPALWQEFGKSAAFVRNQAMADWLESQDLIPTVVAAWDGKSKGTLDMIQRAVKAGAEVKLISIAP